MTFNNYTALILATIGFVTTSVNAGDQVTPETSPIAKANYLTSTADAVRSFRANSQMKQRNNGIVQVKRRSQDKVDRQSNAAKTAQTKTIISRDKQPQKSANSHEFSFYSSDVFLNFDLDGDGYYSDLTIDFDADYSNGLANVYAIIYTSENGGPWTQLLVTDSFSIFSNDADNYSVTSVLNFGYPTGDYDILIDLYEDGISGIVATVGPNDDGDLFALPLEDEAHELSSNTSQISYVASNLTADFDADGFYTDLTLEYDINTAYQGDIVYAEIVLTNTLEGWQEVVSTDNFLLGTQTEFIDLSFNSAYPAGWYDVEIHLINVFTGEKIADAAQEYLSLRSLPIESVNNDNFFDLPPTSGTDVDVVVYGGGSLGWGVLVVGMFGLVRRKKTLAKR